MALKSNVYEYNCPKLRPPITRVGDTELQLNFERAYSKRTSELCSSSHLRVHQA